MGETNLHETAEAIVSNIRNPKHCKASGCKSKAVPLTKHCWRHQPWLVHTVYIVLLIFSPLLKQLAEGIFHAKSASERLAEQKLKEPKRTTKLLVWFDKTACPEEPTNSIALILPYDRQTGLAKFKFAVEHLGSYALKGARITVIFPEGLTTLAVSEWKKITLSDRGGDAYMVDLDKDKPWYPRDKMTFAGMRIQATNWTGTVIDFEVKIQAEQMADQGIGDLTFKGVAAFTADGPQLSSHEPFLANVTTTGIIPLDPTPRAIK